MKYKLFFGMIMLLAMLFGGNLVAAADLNAFSISTYAIDYTLGRDSDGASTLTTKETIVAQFSMDDVNHGIERYIPKNYDGHPLDLKIVSVKDESGVPRHYSTYGSGEYTVLRIGDADHFAHGEQKYEIEYTQKNVTKSFADTNDDEFYWDTNGTEWRVPIEHLQVTLNVDQSLKNSLSGKTACYIGEYEESAQCTLDSGEPLNYTVSSDELSTGENITLAIGFQTGTFSAYKQPLMEKILGYFAYLQAALVAVGIGLASFITARFNKLSKRKGDMGTIVPEYLPPGGTSVTTSAVLLQKSNFATSAQLIDLAVRHYLKLYETKTGTFFTSAQYDIEIVKSIDDLLPEEKELLHDMFGENGATVGQKRSSKDLQKNTKLPLRLRDNPTKARELMRTKYDLYKKSPEQSAWFMRMAKIIGGFSVVLLSPALLMSAVTSFLMAKSLWPLSDRGVDLKRYLEGLKLYIDVGEKERLEMLQSPEGAEKVGVDTGDGGQMVKLYEKLLPYAILFGQEKEWAKQIGNYYQSTDTSPTWYAGHSMAAFNAAAFASSISSVTSSISSTGSSSSSSGGSGGGGFSGGGGGGGGGGGW